MKCMNRFSRIARTSLIWFALVNAALLVGILVLHSGARFAFPLCVLCPILGGVLCELAAAQGGQKRKKN